MTVIPTIPPTPEQAYHELGYQYPTLEDFLEVVRIPIKGPPPFNMLAYVRQPAGTGVVEWTHDEFHRHTITIQLMIEVRGYDREDPDELHQVRHSSTGVIRMLQTASGGMDFHIALDAVHSESTLDRYGRPLLTFEVADRVDDGPSAWNGEISSWVMFHEPAAVPGAPQPTTPDVSTSTLVAAGPIALVSYKEYLQLPNADVPLAASELSTLSAQLAVPPTFADGVPPQQLAVDALTGFTPSPEHRLEHLIALTEARHNLIVRLRDAQDFAPAEALADITLAGYREYAQRAGADLPRVQRDLAELVKPLLTIGAPDAALRSQRAALDVLERIIPDPSDPTAQLEHQISLAEAQHNLVARLLTNGKEQEAATLAATTIAAYLTYAHLPGAMVPRAVTDLRALETEVLTPAGLLALASEAHAAAETLTT